MDSSNVSVTHHSTHVHVCVCVSLSKCFDQLIQGESLSREKVKNGA